MFSVVISVIKSSWLDVPDKTVQKLSSLNWSHWILELLNQSMDWIMLPGSEITILILKSSPRFIFITSGLKLISNNPSSKIVIFYTS